LIWAGAAPSMWLSDVSETKGESVEGEVIVAGWDLVTVRAERS
jgi:hypothetical protein